ncbi:MAG: SpoIID/LytB domain-containing protein [Gemmatimonadota bacterium]
MSGPIVRARRARRLTSALACLLAAGCVQPGTTPGAPGAAGGPVSQAPAIRVGLVTGARTAQLGGGASLAVTQPDGSLIGILRAGDQWTATAANGGFTFTGPSAPSGESYTQVDVVPADSGGLVGVNGREYRGRLTLLQDRAGLTVVNRLDLESYLAGVVSAEMGRRDSTEREALLAQAVVSRTYALRNMGRWSAQGYDLLATVADQAYGGVAAESALGWEAVRATHGEILTYGGAPIDAFFYSTCGGRTEAGPDVFANANPAYLRSVADTDAHGNAWCSISPRFRWREAWTGEALEATLRRHLPAIAGVPASRIAAIRGVRVTGRTTSGRAAGLLIDLKGGPVRVPGPAIRQVLRPVSGEILRSTAITLEQSVARHRVTRLVVDGRGNGHGVGFCQWGAVGRARAGQGYREILSAYYQGVALERRY